MDQDTGEPIYPPSFLKIYDPLMKNVLSPTRYNGCGAWFYRLDQHRTYHMKDTRQDRDIFAFGYIANITDES